MSTTTTNYGLVKPELTDVADITLMNPNWDTVDAKLKELQENVKTYTTLEQLGLSGKVTLTNVVNAMPDCSQLILDNYETANSYVAYCPYSTGTLTVTKMNSKYYYAEFMISSDYRGSKEYFYNRGNRSDGLFEGWKQIAIEDEHNIKSFTTLEQIDLSDGDSDMIFADDFSRNIGQILAITYRDSATQYYFVLEEGSNFRASVNKKLSEDLGVSLVSGNAYIIIEKVGRSSYAPAMIRVFDESYSDGIIGNVYCCMFNNNNDTNKLSPFVYLTTPDGFITKNSKELGIKTYNSILNIMTSEEANQKIITDFNTSITNIISAMPNNSILTFNVNPSSYSNLANFIETKVETDCDVKHTSLYMTLIIKKWTNNTMPTEVEVIFDQGNQKYKCICETDSGNWVISNFVETYNPEGLGKQVTKLIESGEVSTLQSAIQTTSAEICDGDKFTGTGKGRLFIASSSWVAPTSIIIDGKNIGSPSYTYQTNGIEIEFLKSFEVNSIAGNTTKFYCVAVFY